MEALLNGLYNSWPVVVTLIGCAVWTDRRFIRLEVRSHSHEDGKIVKLKGEGPF